jgi:hypothetical protein
MQHKPPSRLEIRVQELQPATFVVGDVERPHRSLIPDLLHNRLRAVEHVDCDVEDAVCLVISDGDDFLPVRCLGGLGSFRHLDVFAEWVVEVRE